MSSERIHITCSADTRFASDCAVMLRSLLRSNAGEAVDVHFIHDGRLPGSDLRGLAGVVTGNGGVWSPLKVPNDCLDVFPFTHRYGLNAWYRTLLPSLLPQLPRVLYLDSDLLIRGRLRPLWETDLSNCCVAAVTQPVLPEVLPRLRDTLGLPDAASYFNSGVMLLDLNELRVERLTERVIDFVRSGRAPMPWADQDPLNAILHHRRIRLHPRWNVMTPLFDLPARMLPFEAEEICEAIEQPVIVHFIGPYKPWHYRCRHPFRAEYFEHLRHTPWHNRPIEGRTLRHVVLRPMPRRWQPYLDGYLDRIATVVRRMLRRDGRLP